MTLNIIAVLFIHFHTLPRYRKLKAATWTHPLAPLCWPYEQNYSSRDPLRCWALSLHPSASVKCSGGSQAVTAAPDRYGICVVHIAVRTAALQPHWHYSLWSSLNTACCLSAAGSLRNLRWSYKLESGETADPRMVVWGEWSFDISPPENIAWLEKLRGERNVCNENKPVRTVNFSHVFCVARVSEHRRTLYLSAAYLYERIPCIPTEGKVECNGMVLMVWVSLDNQLSEFYAP